MHHKVWQFYSWLRQLFSGTADLVRRKKNQTNPHCGKWCKCIVKLKKKQKKNIEDQGRNIPSYLWDITSFNQNSFTFLKILMREKKRTKSPKYKDTLKKGIFSHETQESRSFQSTILQHSHHFKFITIWKKDGLKKYCIHK